MAELFGNSDDHDQMLHYMASNLVLHCLLSNLDVPYMQSQSVIGKTKYPC